MPNPNCPECKGTGKYTGSLFGGEEPCSLCGTVEFKINPSQVFKGCFISAPPKPPVMSYHGEPWFFNRNRPAMEVSKATDSVQDFIDENDQGCRNRDGLCLQGYIADAFLFSIMRLHSERYPYLEFEHKPDFPEGMMVRQPMPMRRVTQHDLISISDKAVNDHLFRPRQWCFEFSRMAKRSDLWTGLVEKSVKVLQLLKENSLGNERNGIRTAYLPDVDTENQSGFDVRMRTKGPISVRWISDVSERMVLFFNLYEKCA